MSVTSFRPRGAITDPRTGHATQSFLRWLDDFNRQSNQAITETDNLSFQPASVPVSASLEASGPVSIATSPSDPFTPVSLGDTTAEFTPI